MTHEKSKHRLLTLRREPTSEAAVPLPPKRWVSRIGLPGGIILICLILLLYTARDSLWPATEVSVLRVIAKVTTQSVGRVTVQAPGWVEADPFPIYVSGLAPGVVDEVLVLEGQAVKAGDVVATLIEDDARLALAQAQAELKRRQAELPLYQAALSAAQTDWDNPIDRDQAVAVNQAKLQESRAELDRLASEITMHQAKLAELEDSHQRLLALLPNASAELEVKQMQFRCAAQKALLDTTQKQQHVIQAQIQRCAADLKAAQAHRQLLIKERKMRDEAQAQVEMIKAQIGLAEVTVAQAQLRMDRMKIRAQVDGVVMTRLAVPGSKVMLEADMKESAHVVYLYDPQKLQVRVDVPLADAAQVGVGQKARVVVDVLPDREFAGHVSRIVHKADIEKNTLEVKVALEDPAPELKPEMLARIKFIGAAGENSDSTALSVFVPERLCRERSGDRARIWQVTAQSTALLQDITLGPHRQEGWVEIVTGLKLGDIVIADPKEGLRDGRKVRISGEWSGDS
jgi:HlyD family secretion protein